MDMVTVSPWLLIAYAIFQIVQCVIQLINARSVGKRISGLCTTCLSPIIAGEKHDCTLNDDELLALEKFVALIQSHKKDGDVNG